MCSHRRFGQVNGEQQQVLEIKLLGRRGDGTQIGSNMRTLIGLELLVLVVQRMYRELDEVERADWQAEIETYWAEPARRFTDCLRCEEPHAHLTSLGQLMERLVCQLRPRYAETSAYQVLCRVMEEHLVVGKGVAMSRPDGERSVCGVQSPDDLEATYRA